jgi:Domain of unknown function (DUF4276)
MVKEIRLYVEGAGRSEDSKTNLRKAFGSFLTEAKQLAQRRHVRWRIVACGGRNEAFADFRDGLTTHADAFNVLLVDAETEVTKEAWLHLREAPDGPMDVPAELSDRCHLMVQAMEAWLVIDRENLVRFYGKELHEKALPTHREIERVARQDLHRALTAATKDSSKGAYHKTRHGFDLLARTNPAKVRAAAPHCARLFDTLFQYLSE